MGINDSLRQGVRNLIKWHDLRDPTSAFGGRSSVRTRGFLGPHVYLEKRSGKEVSLVRYHQWIDKYIDTQIKSPVVYFPLVLLTLELHPTCTFLLEGITTYCRAAKAGVVGTINKNIKTLHEVPAPHTRVPGFSAQLQFLTPTSCSLSLSLSPFFLSNEFENM